MFDFDAGKLLIVGVMALIFIPPKDLPRVMRQAGQFVGKMRRMASDFQGQFMDAMREADMTEIRREAEALAAAARIDVGFDSVQDLDRQMVAKRQIDKAPELPQPETATAASAEAQPADAEHTAEKTEAPASNAPHPV